MKKFLILLFLLIIPVISAQDWIYNSESLTVELDISSSLRLIQKSPDFRVEYISVNLSLVPQDSSQQEVLVLKTNPKGEKKEGVIEFKWDKPEKELLEFKVNSRIISLNDIIKLKEKIKFPLTEIPKEIKKYTQPSKTIDSNNENIIRLASKLIEGEDDLYFVVFKLAEWTKENIRYDLTTSTGQTTQKASWVLDNKEGVCDELTNLFIALCRALGIPARFISGVSYTNVESSKEGWGPHGWAEVYFPKYGWVPFDVTYGQFGFVDATHIKLKESMDPDEPSTRLQWFGSDIEVEMSKLEIKTKLIEKKGKTLKPISIEGKAIRNNIDFGSYNIIEAKVKNLNDYYISTDLTISKPKEIEVIDKEIKTIVLEPNEEKKIYWIIKVNENLEEEYIYTFPIMIYSTRNVSSITRFDARKGEKKLDLKYIEEILEEEKEEKNISKNIKLDCQTKEKEIYEYQTSKIKCEIENTGNTYIEKLNVCLEEDCKEVDLGITQKKDLNFNFSPKKIGKQEIKITAKNKDLIRSSSLDMTVYDTPSLEIRNITFPKKVAYKGEYKISFILKKKSQYPPYNITIKLSPFLSEWKLSQLNVDRLFNINFYGKELDIGENKFILTINYQDKNGRKYTTNKKFIISLSDVNIMERIIIYLKKILKKTSKLL